MGEGEEKCFYKPLKSLPGRSFLFLDCFSLKTVSLTIIDNHWQSQSSTKPVPSRSQPRLSLTMKAWEARWSEAEETSNSSEMSLNICPGLWQIHIQNTVTLKISLNGWSDRCDNDSPSQRWNLLFILQAKISSIVSRTFLLGHHKKTNKQKTEEWNLYKLQYPDHNEIKFVLKDNQKLNSSYLVASGMTSDIVFAGKPSELNSIPRTHLVERSNSWKLLSHLHTHALPYALHPWIK